MNLVRPLLWPLVPMALGPVTEFLESIDTIPTAHCDHELTSMCNDGREDLPLPEREGWREGEVRVRITNLIQPNERFIERPDGNNARLFHRISK